MPSTYNNFYTLLVIDKRFHLIQIDPKERQRVINIKRQKGIEIFGEKKNHLPWPFLRVTDSGRGSRPVPIREWSLPATATTPSNAPVQRPSRPSPRPGPARSLRPFRPGSRAPANENVSFQRGPFFFFTITTVKRNDRPTSRRSRAKSVIYFE